jgi:hypothetical protein
MKGFQKVFLYKMGMDEDLERISATISGDLELLRSQFPYLNYGDGLSSPYKLVVKFLCRNGSVTVLYFFSKLINYH